MSDDKPANTKPTKAKPANAREAVAQIPAWKKLLCALAATIAVAGAGLWTYAAVTAPDQPTTASTPKSGANPLTPDTLLPNLPGSTSQNTDPQPDAANRAIDQWSPAVFRMGFGFFAGFAMAFALRTFVKISILVIGLILLALSGLAYAGIIDVNWDAMKNVYDTSSAWLSTEFQSFMSFLTGYLPSGAATTFGAVLGFRKG